MKIETEKGLYIYDIQLHVACCAVLCCEVFIYLFIHQYPLSPQLYVKYLILNHDIVFIRYAYVYEPSRNILFAVSLD